MPAFLLCLLLVGATTLAWAQEATTLPAPPTPEARPQLSRAALDALSQEAPHWENLAILATAAALPDRVLAAPAAQIGSELAHTIDSFDVEDKEIPRASLRALQLRWLQIADTKDRWVDIRVYALDVASRLHALQQPPERSAPETLWLVFLDPQMRSAALTFVPETEALRQVATKMLISDASEEVSLAAGQRLCGPLRIGAADLPTLDDQALAKLQALASKQELPITARSHLAPCLVADGSMNSRRALGFLLQKSPPALRRHLIDLVRSRQTERAP